MKCGEFPSQAQHRITIQQRVDVADSYGGTTVTWSTLQQSWAVIEPSSGRESYLQGQLQSRVSSKMTIRYIAGLKNTATAAKYRVSYDDRIFSVKYIKNLDESLTREGKVYQQLLCEENDAEN